MTKASLLSTGASQPSHTANTGRKGTESAPCMWPRANDPKGRASRTSAPAAIALSKATGSSAEGETTSRRRRGPARLTARILEKELGTDGEVVGDHAANSAS